MIRVLFCSLPAPYRHLYYRFTHTNRQHGHLVDRRYGRIYIQAGIEPGIEDDAADATKFGVSISI